MFEWENKDLQTNLNQSSSRGNLIFVKKKKKKQNTPLKGNFELTTQGMPETNEFYKLQRISLTKKASPIRTPFHNQDCNHQLSFHMSLLAQNYRSLISGSVKLSTILAFASYDERNGCESGARK